MGVLFLTARDGYAFSGAAGDRTVIDAPEGSLGTHGYVSTDPDLQALFIASGRGIKPGMVLDSVNNVDVAPTAATLLGLQIPNPDGTVLTDILTSGSSAMRR
jgi:predicted AlkP superfamily pyrophosphatase or phosphodiesterase